MKYIYFLPILFLPIISFSQDTEYVKLVPEGIIVRRDLFVKVADCLADYKSQSQLLRLLFQKACSPECHGINRWVKEELKDYGLFDAQGDFIHPDISQLMQYGIIFGDASRAKEGWEFQPYTPELQPVMDMPDSLIVRTGEWVSFKTLKDGLSFLSRVRNKRALYDMVVNKTPNSLLETNWYEQFQEAVMKDCRIISVIESSLWKREDGSIEVVDPTGRWDLIPDRVESYDKKECSRDMVEKKYIDEQKAQGLRAACDEQSPGFFKCAKEFGISDEHLAQALAEKFECSYVAEITEQMTDPEVLSQIPLKFLREQMVIPVRLSASPDITLISANPFNFQPLDELSLLLHIPTQVAVATPAVIIEAINKFYPFESSKEVIEGLEEEKEFSPELDFAAINEEDILGMASEAPIIKLVNHILYQGVKQGASDIHIEPFEKELRVRYRIDGILYPGIVPPKRAQAAIISRIKIMGNMNIAEKRHPQGGRIQIKIADKAIDIRVSVLPTVYGERVVMRLLDKAKTFKQLDELGLSERDYRVLIHAIEQPNGIILVTGPTGSGKTSTLYAVLNKLNSPEVNIVTVEDPVEYQMVGIGQVQVQDKIGLTFAAVLREILRQDPDIIMIGETRDQETAQIAIQASLTGHLVLTTLHTNSSAASITRLIDMGIEPFLLASSVIAIMAQRLVRKLCDHCKEKYTPTPEVLQRIGISPQEAQQITFYKPVGCKECLNNGYSGRIPLFEIMVMTHAIARLTIERADTQLIQEAAIKDGMTLLVQDGIEKIKKGLTTIEEVLSVATSQEVIE